MAIEYDRHNSQDFNQILVDDTDQQQVLIMSSGSKVCYVCLVRSGTVGSCCSMHYECYRNYKVIQLVSACIVAVMQTGDVGRILTGPEESLRSHLLCFAAEKSRTEHRVIDLSSDEMAA